MALYERMAPPRWKPVRNFPGYEISEEGQVRVNSLTYSGDNMNVLGGLMRYNGTVKARYWRCWSRSRRTADYIREHDFEHKETHGSLCVRLLREGKNHDVRVANLMDTHWPNAPYPEWWRNSSTVSLGKDNRKALTDEERIEIIKSPASGNSLARQYGVSVSTIWRVRRGEDSFSAQWLEENPEYKMGWRDSDKHRAGA